MRAAVISSDEPNSVGAAEYITAELRKSLKGDPGALIVFAAPAYDHHVLLETITRLCPDSIVVGASSAGEFTNATSGQGLVCALGLAGDDVAFTTSVGRDLHSDPMGVAQKIASGFTSSPPSIYLPRDLGARGNAEGDKIAEAPSLLRGDETILVVEDHPDLRAYSSGVLRELGYKILEAADAAAAISILNSGILIDLLFTDVVLPDGAHGKIVAEHAKRLRSDTKILFTTGYTRNAIVHNGRLDAGVNLLNKPFTFEALAKKVRTILDEL